MLTSMVLACLLPLASLARDSPKKCEEFSKLSFFCVPYYQCNENRTIITDGKDLIDVRTIPSQRDLEEAADSECEKITEVCCRHITKEAKEQQQQKGEPREQPPKIGATEKRSTPRCGFRGKTISPGKTCDISQLQELTIPEAEFAEWPHVCMILKKERLDIDTEADEEVTTYVAGASLIAEEVILTGVNRIYLELDDLSRLTVRCGEWDVITTNESKPYQDRNVVRVDVHPGYNPENSFNNFAVVYVDKPFDLDIHIAPVCLPPPNVVYPAGTPCVANGWGKDRFGNDGKFRTKMKRVNVDLVDTNTCQEKLRETRLGRFFELDRSFMCAGGCPGMDTCKGDGGSPLVCEVKNGVWAQVGLVAWGISCGENKLPGVYSNIAHAVCWIDEKVTDYFSTKKTAKDSYFGIDRSACITEEVDIF